MLCMKTYMFCFSVRLGVLITSISSFISSFIPWILLLTFGMKLWKPVQQLLTSDEETSQQGLIHAFCNFMESEPTTFLAILNIILCVHMLTSVLAFYGAFKLKKLFVIPLAIFEAIRVIYSLCLHIVLMNAYRYQINLGLLIILTITGGFIVLYWAYNCCTCVTFYQIMNLITSPKYQQLYGDDPFNPIIPAVTRPQQSSAPIVDVIITNNNYNSLIGLKKPYNEATTIRPSFISVLPANFRSPNKSLPTYPVINNERNWQRVNSKLREMDKQEQQQQQIQQQKQQYNKWNVNYDNYWQLSELPQYSKYSMEKANYIKNYWH